jgi:hypothetical protein
MFRPLALLRRAQSPMYSPYPACYSASETLSPAREAITFDLPGAAVLTLHRIHRAAATRRPQCSAFTHHHCLPLRSQATIIDSGHPQENAPQQVV